MGYNGRMAKRVKNDGVDGTGAAPVIRGPGFGGSVSAEDALPTLTMAELDALTMPADGEDEGETGPQKARREKLSTGQKMAIVGDLANGLKVPQVAKKYGLTYTAVVRAAQDPELYGLTDKSAVKVTKQLLASRFYQLADLALSHIDADKLKKMDPYRLAFMSAVALDKARLLEGESTENLSFKGLALNIHATLENLKERKRAILDRVKGLGGALED